MRLHPKKGKRWIKERYYPVYYDGNHHDNWVLTDPQIRNSFGENGLV